MNFASPLRPSRARGFSHPGSVTIGEESYPCQISNMSMTAATLTFDVLRDLPDRLTLCLGERTIVRQCTIVWNDGLQVGVLFDR
jgi:hypothetical protein